MGGIVPGPRVGIPGPHADQHKDGGTDEVATATPGANEIPKADGAGKLDDWVTVGNVAASTVESETAYGQAAAVGTDSEYARQDHTHGTPAKTAPLAHAAAHKNGGADEIATVVSAAGAIPKADGAGKIPLAFISKGSVLQHAAGQIALRFALPITVFNTDTPGATVHGVGSRIDPRLVGVTVDNVTPQNHTHPLQSQVVVEILTLAATGTLRLTGDSYDPDTGAISVADTEDIAISATGFASSAKQWEGAVTVVLSTPDTLDCTLDSFAFAPLAGGLGALTIDSITSHGNTSGATNDFRVQILKYEDGVGLTTLYDRTKTNQPSGIEWTDSRSSIGVSIGAGESIVFAVTTQRITDLTMVLSGTQDNV